MRFTVKYPEFHLSTRGPKKHSKASAKGMEEEQCKPANMDVNSAGAIVVQQI